MRGAIDVDQCTAVAIAQRQNAHAFFVQAAVPLSHGTAHFLGTGIGAAKQVSGFDARECRGTVANDCFLRHRRLLWLVYANFMYIIAKKGASVKGYFTRAAARHFCAGGE